MSSHQVAKLAVGYVPRNTVSDQDTCRNCAHSERRDQTLNCTKSGFWVWSSGFCRFFSPVEKAETRMQIGPLDIS